MGFTPEPEILKLTFEEGTSLDGLIVRVQCCTIREWNKMLKDSSTGSRNGNEVASGNEEISRRFIEKVVDWNLEWDGEPAPVTYESFDRLSQRQGGIIIAAWQSAMVDVPTNSSDNLNNGESSLEKQLGLVNEFESLPNWKPQS